MRLYFALQTLRKPLIFLFFLLTLGVAAWSQGEDREIYTVAELQDMQKAAIGKELLSDEMRDTVSEQYSAAIEAVKQVEEFLSFRDEYQQELILTGQVQASLLEELAVPESSPVVDFPELMTVDQAENALARERARHSANLAELHDQQLIADDMSVSRSNISQHLGELDLRIDLLNREYRSQQGSTEIDIIRRAEKLRILSLKAAAESESEMLRARLELLTGKSQYVPLNIDLAQRRVSYSQELVDIYKNHVLVLQAEQAVSSLKFVHKMSDQLLSDFPQLSELIEETELMALNLWGPDGIIELSEQTSQDLSEARTFQTQLRRIAELTRRKFETYGNRGNLYRWWPQLPDNFPEHGKVSRIIDNLDVEIPEVDYQLINLSQKRSKAYELIRITLVALDRERSEKLSAADEQRIRNYLDIRQNLLDQLIQRGGVYATQLVEYQEVSRNFLNQINEVESFLFSHVLWSRSVPRPIIPKLRDMVATVAWAVSTSHWNNFSIRAVSPGIFLLLILLLLVISFRKILYRRLNYISAKVMNPEEDSFSLTPRALVLTILLALPLPLGLAAAGKLTGIFGDSLYWVAISSTFNQMAVVMALLETARMVFIEHGLAETHFSWPVQTTRGLYKGLLKSEILSMPILCFSLFLVFAGGRLDSQLDYRVYHNSLGRLAFIFSLMILGLSVLSLIKPEKQKKLSPDYARVSWPRQFSAYAFPKVFLGAYPIIFIATVIPSLLSIAGYYLTGLLLAYQMLRTMILLLIVFLISGIIQRSLQLAKQK
ncbi:MAG: hypothetical protein KAH21_13010, partial [Spirochaetaceae bacterium]|nr:hypothetical protein [Spirochaetaceae bacterium]